LARRPSHLLQLAGVDAAQDHRRGLLPPTFVAEQKAKDTWALLAILHEQNAGLAGLRERMRGQKLGRKQNAQKQAQKGDGSLHSHIVILVTDQPLRAASNS
jgi:hypothetical protein